MRQHTPGSWTVDIDHKAPCYNVRTKVTQNGFANPVVCTLWDDFCTDAEAEANAYLIAASPIMYDALCKIDANAAESVEWIRRVAREAIAKVEGGN
jgi:hypothetical protein